MTSLFWLAAAWLASTIALPGGRPVGMDYLAFDRANDRLWVPSGNTGTVNVLDAASGKLHTLGGFATAASTRPGRPSTGPSSVAVGDGTAWVGNRADGQVCAFDAKTLAPGACTKLPSMPDGITFVRRTAELWVTTPRDHTVTIVGTREGTKAGTKTGAKVGAKTGAFTAPVAIPLEGRPEGYAVDERRAIFYTNLEDADATLAIDVKTRRVIARWPTGCGVDGPRGLALDETRQLLFAACTHGAVTLDVGHGGAIVGRLEAGGGVDNLDYDPARGLLFVASPRDGTLIIARVAKGGALASVAVVPTAAGARNAVVDGRGTAYVADSPDGAVVIVPLPAALR